MLDRLKANIFRKYQQSFSYQYSHCNRCNKELDIKNDEEVVCILCGETFCEYCIAKHQVYCYG